MDATTGPITVATTQGFETTVDPFTVTLSKDFSLEASPANPSLVAGSYRFISIGASPIDDFTDLIGLYTDPLPSGLSMLFLPSQISPGELSAVKIIAEATATPGTYPVTVHGTAQIDGQTITRDVALSVEILPTGTTTLTGQVLSTEDIPLEGVFVTLGNANDTTDAGGNFLLSNVPTGHQMILIDGRTAIAPGEFYPEVVVSVDITGGQGNVMPYLVYLPKLDIDNPINLPIDASGTTTQEVIATTPKIPDLEVRIPAGTQIIDPAGNPVSQITITAVPPDRSPMPFPSNAEGAQIFTIQPGGSTLSQPVPITFPNTLNGDPGERADFYYFDVTSGSWNLYGQGTVSPDARQVVPDPGVGIPIFAWHFTARQLVQDQTPKEQTVEVNDPVDVTTGLLMVEKTDMVLPGRIPIALTRTYHQGRTTQGDFGIGSSHNYDMRLFPSAGGESLVLIQGDDKRFRFSLESGNTFVSINSPAMRGATATLNPDNSGTVRLKDGTVLNFDTNGRLIQHQDRNGNQLIIDRDSSGRILSVHVPQGGYLEFDYDGSNRITSVTDSILRQVTYSYNAQGRLEMVIDPAGGETLYTYDAQGRLETVTDARGITYLQNEYDANGRVIKQSNADGGIYQYQYFGPNGRALLSGPTSATGLPTGGCGPGTVIVQPGDPIPPGALCVVQVVVPSPANFLVSQAIVIDPEGNAESFRFNSAGFLIEQTDALGHTTKFDREIGTNRLLSTTDALGRKTTFTYDERENVTSITDPQQNVTQFTYEPTFNRLTSITDALNQTTTFEYDANGNFTKTIDPLLNETTITYNSFGQPETVTNPLLNTTQFEYDARGNLKATVDPLGNRTTRVYDAVSRLISLTDPLGATTRFGYDALNRVTQITDAKNGITGFTYDENGNLLTVTDANSHITSYTYDVQDRLDTRTDPLNREESYTYDLNGNLKTFTDRKLQVSTFTYDALDRRTLSQYDDGSTTSFTYDTVGRLTVVEDTTSGRIEFTYDNLDRLVQELTPQGTVEYQYDAIGRRTNMTVNGQSPVTYQYDSASRLTQVAQGTQVVGLGYDQAGRRTTLSYPNGIETSYLYDQSSRLLEIEHLNVSTQELIERLIYAYDAAGNRISFTRTNGTATLLPDAVQAAYDAANEQIQFDSTTPNLTYDANGNLTSQTDANGTTTYTWDARNRLVAMSGPGVSASFVYDALGRRISKTINGVTTDFQYDGNDIVAEIGGAAVGATYLRSLAIDEPFVRQSATTEYYHTDALGSALALSDQAGTVQTTYRYDPFGNTTMTGSSTNLFQYTGRENDGTGLYYYRARYYSPSLQRFLSEDPIGLAGGQLNLYGYVSNNPTTFTDATGLFADIFVDASLILYDLYRLAADGRKGLGENLTALSLDVGGLFVPFVTGLGPVSRIAGKGLEGIRDIGRAGKGKGVREVVGTAKDAENVFKQLSQSGKPVQKPDYPGNMVELPDGTLVGFRPASKSGPPTIDINIPGQNGNVKIKFVDK
jgi:RHS repeat-associated protein